MSDLPRAPLSAFKPYKNNARTHSKRQIEQIAASIEEFGFVNPVLVDDDMTILAGHGRVLAAKFLRLEDAPYVKLSHLDEGQRRAYVLADNRLAERAGWDKEVLAIELQHLADVAFKMDAIGFETPEIDFIVDAARDSDPSTKETDEDRVPAAPEAPCTRAGDVWVMGRHRLVCGDALCQETYSALLENERVAALFTDPPYNVRIAGFASPTGAATRREFEMASGEMSSTDFTSFLQTSLCAAAAAMTDGAIAFVCMDWRHMGELIAAGEAAFDELKNVCVWTKSNGGMGSLYRSQHEMVFVFKKGQAAHQNNVQLGKHGRYRTNVWTYAGANVFSRSRAEDLAMHPTVKPVALVEDALKDVTRRGDLVLDPFGGSGSTLIAAQKCGRSARLIEVDPLYCDVIVKRYQVYTGKSAHRLSDGAAFDDLALEGHIDADGAPAREAEAVADANAELSPEPHDGR